MKIKAYFVIIIIFFLIVGIFSGCIQNPPTSTSNNNYQPWKDATITLNGIQYAEKYDSQMGDYRSVAVQLKINYSVYIDTYLPTFSFGTSKGKIIRGLNWQGNGYSSSNGQMSIKLDKKSSPGSFILYLSYDGIEYKSMGYGYIIEKNENITSFNFEVTDARSTNDYTIPIRS